MTIRACPRCGNPVENTCHHDGVDEASVEMPIIDALKLAQEAREEAMERLERACGTVDLLAQTLAET